jgi:hypothetical protein
MKWWWYEDTGSKPLPNSLTHISVARVGRGHLPTPAPQTELYLFIPNV